jgi:hypothetical protein
MKPNSGVANKGIERILELSADAHIRRRGTVKDSPEFHNLTGAIAAYGRALALLTALQQREEFCEMIAQRDAPGGVDLHCYNAAARGSPGADGTYPFKCEGQPDNCGIFNARQGGCANNQLDPLGLGLGGGDCFV